MDAAGGSAPELSAEDKQMLLQLARQTLNDYLREGELPHWQTDSPALLQPCAAFVTLRRDSGQLRGCRGECVARRPLVESVVHMAIASATDDPRFPPVTIDEVPHVHIEISVLTPLKPIQPEQVVVGQHGLMIVRGRYAGLLLPEVPVAFGWDRGEFLKGLCRKAGLPLDAWKATDVQLYGFEADAWGEEGHR